MSPGLTVDCLSAVGCRIGGPNWPTFEWCGGGGGAVDAKVWEWVWVWVRCSFCEWCGRHTHKLSHSSPNLCTRFPINCNAFLMAMPYLFVSSALGY